MSSNGAFLPPLCIAFRCIWSCSITACGRGKLSAACRIMTISWTTVIARRRSVYRLPQHLNVRRSYVRELQSLIVPMRIMVFRVALHGRAWVNEHQRPVIWHDRMLGSELMIVWRSGTTAWLTECDVVAAFELSQDVGDMCFVQIVTRFWFQPHIIIL